MNRFFSLFLFSLIVSFGCKSKLETPKDKLPNVIIILVDDAGYVDFGFMGSKDLQTPHIDDLAKSGVIFTDAHVSATVCAPSRAGLITGKYQQRFGFEANGTGGIGLSDDVTTIADVFQNNGYNTYALGKWHLGEETSDHPNQRGFDEFYGFLAGSRSYFSLENPSKEKMLQHNGKRVVFDGYMTDVLGDQSVQFVADSKEKPFFMYLSYNAVHTPMHAKKEDLEKFKDHPRQKLAAMTWNLDKNIGKLLTKLDDLGIRENTLIYFLSDNGGAHNNQSSTGVLKGWKGNKFEGGHRVPFVISWPKMVNGNQKFEGLSSSLDIFTTSLSAAKINKPKALQLDGKNLLPYVKGEKKCNPHETLFWRKLEESAVRKGNFKMIHLQNYGAVMYNLNKDLGEINDISKQNKSQLDSMFLSYHIWQQEMKTPLWVEGKDWMNVTYHIHQKLMQNKIPEYKDIWSPAFKEKKYK
ncbi:sulfatase-like hydrolase/transferase [Polaribacter tangerinus]|uniref:sulfatase-like hydrolase/transferase n=1 Tax=Polaribacter tangerinus TaxID=1920034 RepID=UPI000B4B1DFD|nr:sulfatase-like hydrolase/transferase [Polaribacter tangerinus]